MDVAALIAEISRQRVIELFAGPGGYSEGLAMLGLERQQAVGIEFEENACATAEAAGHRRLRADVTRLSPLEVACFYFPSTRGAITLFHASPPCQGFSMAGKGKGREDGDLLRDVLRAAAAGHLSSEEAVQYVKDNAIDDKSHLSIEPLRWMGELLPENITLEQVPAVLPLWEEYAVVLRAWGYSVVTGNVQAEQYGVPQTRKRAILLASRVREVSMPVPTHSKYHNRSPERLDEGVEKWVSMAEALGWGMTHRPYLTISPGVGQGGPDSLKLGGSGARKVVYREYEEGRWVCAAGVTGAGAPRPVTHPAPTVTGKGTAYLIDDLATYTGPAQPILPLPFPDHDPEDVEYVAGTHERATRRTADLPAPTLFFGGRLNKVEWQPTHMGDVYNRKGCIRSVDEPAPTMTSSMDNGNFQWVDGENPPEKAAERLDRKRVAEVAAEREHNQSGTDFDLEWPCDRPAPVIAGRGLVTMPGANANRFNGATKSRNDGLRVTEEEAGVLQSFPAHYPWRGNKTSRFQQIGNAVPPLLAARMGLCVLGWASVTDNQHDTVNTEREEIA